MDIEKLFKVARLSNGYSINQLASITNISANTIISYEEGRTAPSIPNIVKIANALYIPLNEVDIFEENINFYKDDIVYTKIYSQNNDKYYYGKCKCGEELYVNEKDVNNSLRTKCKKCFLDNIKNLKELNISNEDIEKLDNMFQNNIVKRSIKLGLNCTLTLHDYLHLITQNCYYCGVKPEQETIINNKLLLHNGIDRLDSKKGYEKDNVVPCCTKCNMAKGSLSKEEFLELVQNIYNNKY